MRGLVELSKGRKIRRVVSIGGQRAIARDKGPSHGTWLFNFELHVRHDVEHLCKLLKTCDPSDRSACSMY